MPDEFPCDVFFSHSAKDEAVVRPLAERLRADGVKVWFDEWVLPVASVYDRRGGRSQSAATAAKIEEGRERSRVLVPCLSANAFGSDWAQLESGMFRFRDPLNKERRFLPLRLDDAPTNDFDWFRKDDDVRGQFANRTQSRTLATPRDTLLPKLLSGKLTISHSSIQKV